MYAFIHGNDQFTVPFFLYWLMYIHILTPSKFSMQSTKYPIKRLDGKFEFKCHLLEWWAQMCSYAFNICRVYEGTMAKKSTTCTYTFIRYSNARLETDNPKKCYNYENWWWINWGLNIVWLDMYRHEQINSLATRKCYSDKWRRPDLRNLRMGCAAVKTTSRRILK